MPSPDAEHPTDVESRSTSIDGFKTMFGLLLPVPGSFDTRHSTASWRLLNRLFLLSLSPLDAIGLPPPRSLFKSTPVLERCFKANARNLKFFFRGRPSFLTHKLSWKLVCECCGPMEPALRGALKQTRYCRIIVDGNNLIHPITDCAGQGEKFDERRNSGIQGMKAMCSFR